MNRIEEKFLKLKNENKKAFIAYICAGDTSLDNTEKLVYTLEEAGTDIIELGIPFSDPLADGIVIQEAAIRSLNNNFKIKDLFKKIKDIRKNSQIPLVIMVYYSSIYGFGKEKFINSCVESEVDGIIIPDLPYEENEEIKPLIDKTDLCLIPLLTVTSEDRIPMIAKESKGFIYCVSSMGVTGERTAFHSKVNDFIKTVKAHTNTPVCVGFGISKREDVERFNKIADGTIVGSAIVKTIFNSNMDLEKIKEFIKNLKTE